jgi:protein subunit release factor A
MCYAVAGRWAVSVIVEIRAAEGGDDAKLLVKEQVVIYSKLAGRRAL